MDLNNRRTGKHATKPRALGLLGHSDWFTLVVEWSLQSLWPTIVFDDIEDISNSIRTQQRGFHNGPCCSPCTSDNSHPNSSVGRQRNFSYSHIHMFVVTWITLTPDWTAVIWPTTERWAGTVLNASEKTKQVSFGLLPYPKVVSLKLVRNILNNRVLGTSKAAIFFKMIILSMHPYTSDGRHAWFHLYRASRPARSASKAKKYKMKKIRPHWDLNLQPWDLKSDALPNEPARLVEDCVFKLPYYILPIIIYILVYVWEWWRRAYYVLFTNVLFWVTYWSIYLPVYCTYSKETHKSCVCFQHANMTKHSTWSGICMLKANRGLMRLFGICTI